MRWGGAYVRYGRRMIRCTMGVIGIDGQGVNSGKEGEV